MSTDTSPAPASVEAPAPIAPAAPAAPVARPRRFAALQHRDYRLYWIGSLISLLGTQMSGVAVGWQVYQLTRDPLMLGLTGLFTAVPLVLFSLYGGVVADALDRRRLLMVTQVVLLGVSVVLAVTTLTGLISVWIIFVVAAVQGAVTAFNNPARSALIPNLVPREHLTNAISLGVTSWQVGAVVGPAMAGLLIGAGSHAFGPAGISVVYIIDAVSFLAVIGALWLIRARTQVAETREITLAAALEGLRFVFHNSIMWGTMILDFFATFFGASLLLMPVFAADVLHVGPEGLGFLLAAPSAGAVVTAALMASWGQVRRQGLVVLWSVAAYGLAWIVFGLTRNFWIALLALAGTGAADTVSMIMRQTIRQLTTPDALRGRMTSVNMIFFMGGPHLGEFEGGIIARLWSAPVAAISGGIGVLLATAFVALGVPSVRNYEAE